MYCKSRYNWSYQFDWTEKNVVFGVLSNLREPTEFLLRGSVTRRNLLAHVWLRFYFELHEFYNCSLALLRHYVSESRSTDGTSFGNCAINEVEKWLKALLYLQARTSYVLGSSWIKADISVPKHGHIRRNVRMSENETINGLSIVLANGDADVFEIISLSLSLIKRVHSEVLSMRFFINEILSIIT